MKNIGLGVIEGFYGPEWSLENKLSMCDFISKFGGDYYIYAPKSDAYLRKKWTEDHPEKKWNELKLISSKCAEVNIKFGIGLSPFEVYKKWDETSKKQLKEKILKLEELNIEYIGLFFDDMKGDESLAERQIEIVEFVNNVTNKTVLFCPTYYSDDPVLDKLFGQRSESYLEKIGNEISQDVMFFWTGPQIISNEIGSSHLENVVKQLKRKPVIWENFYANDGPRNCKYLKLGPFYGRDKSSYELSSGWTFNPMNQANLSKISVLAAMNTLKSDSVESADEDFSNALKELTNDNFASCISRNVDIFTEKGLDEIDEEVKKDIINNLGLQSCYSTEVIDWIKGEYNVGSECLTD